MLLQAKQHTYTLSELLLDQELADYYHDGCYATLRITASMYHRFHAPYECVAQRVTYIGGEVWNVNPAALKRVAKLFCKNERAVIRVSLAGSEHTLALVPVAAVLVASIRLHFLDVLLHVKYPGPNEFECCAPFRKGEEMGWFQHGSTIIVLAPKGFSLHEAIRPDAQIRVGLPLMVQP
jgi:phosphatidylserine decarboxylase